MFRGKLNQPTLHEAIALLFAGPVDLVGTERQVNRHGDRTEVRELAVSTELNAWADWPHLAQVGRLVHTRTQRGATTTEVSYLITSLPPDQASAKQLLQLSRGHWGIENRVHWVRDVTFDEDRCQVRSGAAPQVLAACRNLVIALLRRAGATNIAAALRAYSWNAERAIALVTSP